MSIIKAKWDDLLNGTSSISLLNQNRAFFEPFKEDGFIGFCKYFYLDDYIDSKSGDIKQLCDHSGTTHRYIGSLPDPCDEQQCILYIENATKIIDSRTKSMAKSLEILMNEWRGKPKANS